MSETSSVAGTRVSILSAASLGARARAWLFSVRTHNVNYDPPAITDELKERVTFACGQLETPPSPQFGARAADPTDDESSSSGSSSDSSDSDSSSASSSSDGRDEDLTVKRAILFKGYIEFTEQVRLGAVRHWIGQGGEDFRPAFVKDRDQHIRVRTNSETRFRSKIDLIARPHWQIGKGVRPEQGARTDFEAIREILREHGPEEGIRQVAERFPGQFIRYPSGITQLAQAVVPRVREDAGFEFRPWQAAIAKICKGKAHPRHIYWIEDPKGAAGKSRLTTYMCREMNAVELDGRQSDAAFSYTGQPIVLFDLARAVDLITLKDLYIVGEKLKNGQIYSSKYQSRLKVFEVPHVIYFSNSPPPVGVWSADRLQHILLSEHVPFSAGSVEIEPAEPEVTGVDLFKQLLEEAEAARGKKREREDEDEV